MLDTAMSVRFRVYFVSEFDSRWEPIALGFNYRKRFNVTILGSIKKMKHREEMGDACYAQRVGACPHRMTSLATYSGPAQPISVSRN